MKRRFMVIVRAGDRSLHPQWLANTPDRNWDLVVFYQGNDPQRYPVSGDGVVRIDGAGPKWPALGRMLAQTAEIWRQYDAVWLPDDDVAAKGSDINRMFELMGALGLELAQPSLAWEGHVDAPLTLHNPNFAVRFSSFVETWGPCFSRALLDRAVSTFGETTSGRGLGHVWPRFLKNPATQCAILDCIQVTRARPAGGGVEPAIDPRVEMEALLARHRVPGAIQLSYGALDRDARNHNLFDPAGGDFAFRLCEGYVAKLADQPAQLGALFAAHARARAEVLNQGNGDAAPTAPVVHAAPAPAAVQATRPAPAAPRASSLNIAAPPAADPNGAAALDRFKQALAAANNNPAGRAFVPG